MENEIKTFNQREVSMLHSEILTALKEVQKKFGLSQIKLSSISFTPYSFTAKLSADLPEQRNFEDLFAREEAQYFAEQNGLPEDILNKKFINNGKHHTIVRIEVRNTKYPIISKCLNDGKLYKFTVQILKEILTRTDSK